MFSRTLTKAARSGACRRALPGFMHSRSMAQWVVISASGPESTGIVSHVTNTLSDNGGNVAESRMTILGNDFALLTLATVPDKISIQDLEKQILPKEKFPDFAVQVRKTSADPVSSGPVQILRIEVEGPDQPGIIGGLAKVMANFGISIRDCETDTSSAPFAGYRVFTLKSVVAVPLSVDKVEFKKSLADFQSHFGVDVETHRISGGSEA